jgi:nucleoside-diphosphate-sugar epimerase
MLAAIVGVRNVETDPGRVIDVNTKAVLNLVEWLTRRPGPCSSRPRARRTPAR